MMLLENKIAVVTGGTRGIGLATVEAFLREGATVILTGSRQETAEKAVAALKAVSYTHLDVYKRQCLHRRKS